MFYETASRIYDPNGFWKDQSRRLVEVWEQRGNLYRDSLNEAAVEEQEHSEPAPADVHVAAQKAKEFAAWQHNNAQAARLTNPALDEVAETERERKIWFAFMFGAVSGIHNALELDIDDFPSTLNNFFGMFKGISDADEMEEHLNEMNSAVNEVDEAVVETGINAAEEFLEHGRQEESENLLASLLGYI
jgi:hypothetical protein